VICRLIEREGETVRRKVVSYRCSGGQKEVDARDVVVPYVILC
jgi:hypothetical protein